MNRCNGVLVGVVILRMLAAEYANGQSGLSVYGHLTQAYAFTDGHQIFGIPKQGTTDYRNLALQFHYAISPKTAVVIQFSHKRLGLSPAMAFEDEVKLDWAFAKQELSAATSIKLGKVQLPLGIYNELRDVGTVLPFYRASFAVYREGGWTSETLDGVVVSSTINKNSPWNLDIQLFYGGWDSIEDYGVGTLARARNENGLGAQLWLNAPGDALRVGLQGFRYTMRGGFLPAGTKENLKSWMASFDANFSRFVTQAEYIDIEFRTGFSKSYYALMGYKITGNLSLYGQADFSTLRIDIKSPFFSIEAEREYLADYATGLKYAFSDNVVLKAETHWTKGFATEVNPPNFFFGQPEKTKYTIISLSASF